MSKENTNDTETTERKRSCPDSAGSVFFPIKLLEELIEIAYDYTNPNGEKHHGVSPFNRGEACRVAKQAGDIIDSYEYECKSCAIYHDRDEPFCKPNTEDSRSLSRLVRRLGEADRVTSESEILREVGCVMREKRKACKMSLRALAKELGCSSMYLSDMERGNREYSNKWHQKAEAILSSNSRIYGDD